MREKARHIATRLHPKNVVDTFPTFLKDEAISGKLILLATALALIAVNSPLQHAYEDLWRNHLSVGLGSWTLSLDLRHWINEGLMAIFFLVVGLEIKRELVHGELRDVKKAILPIAAAVGGMIVPAILYVAINNQPELIQGWGIPIATDIAFAVAILTLLSRRVPTSLKLFLLTLAIADDIGAIFVIALFYAEIINYWYLALSALILVLLFVFRKRLAGKLAWFLLISIALWLTTHLSGIHASIVGAAVGLISPVALRPSGLSISKRLEDFFLPVSTYAILPLFAFANAGVIISTEAFSNTSSASVMIGVILGLLVGKVIGITAATWLMVRFAKAALPTGTNWRHIIGVGFVAGIGFTVSIFITELAFRTDLQLIESAKIGIFIASIVSGVLGILVLLSARKASELKP
jgi:Na+:H+ antiporter, NhaA family